MYKWIVATVCSLSLGAQAQMLSSPYLRSDATPLDTVMAKIDKSQLQPLTLIDANGKFVGRYFDKEVVVLSHNGVLFSVGVTPPGVGGTFDPTLLKWVNMGAWFASTDCSGVPFITQYITGFRAATTQTLAGTTIAYVGKAGGLSFQIAHSSLDSGGHCYASGGGIDAWPLDFTVNLTQTYPEPLRVQ